MTYHIPYEWFAPKQMAKYLESDQASRSSYLHDTQRTKKKFKLQYGDIDCKKLQDQKSGSLTSKQWGKRVIDSGGTCICVHHHPYVTFMRQMATWTGWIFSNIKESLLIV